MVRNTAATCRCAFMFVVLAATAPLMTVAMAVGAAVGRRASWTERPTLHLKSIADHSDIFRLRGGQDDSPDPMASGASLPGGGATRSASPGRSASPTRPKAGEAKATKGIGRPKGAVASGAVNPAVPLSGAGTIAVTKIHT